MGHNFKKTSGLYFSDKKVDPCLHFYAYFMYAVFL